MKLRKVIGNLGGVLNIIAISFALLPAASFADGEPAAEPRVMIGTAAETGQAKSLVEAMTWTSEDGETPVYTPWTPGSNTCTYVIQSSDKLYGGSTSGVFPNVPVTLSNTTAVVGTMGRSVKFPNMTIAKDAKGFQCNGDGILTLQGKFIVPSGVTFALSANAVGRDGYPNSDSVHRRDVTVSGELQGNSSAQVKYSFGLTGKYDNIIGSEEAQRNTDVFSTLTISGKASSFSGRYTMGAAPETTIQSVKYYGRGVLYLNSATAFGNSSVSKTNTVTLSERTYLKVAPVVTQYADHGVSVVAGKKGGVYADDGDWTLTAPVTCEAGAVFEKLGPDAVTLAGDCSGVSTVEVTEGTLVLSPFGTFKNGLAVTIKPGATLVQNKFIGNIAVTCEEGGTYTEDIQYVVPYSNATGTSMPLDFTTGVPRLPLSFRLSEPIEITSFSPGFETNRIDVARLPSATTATAADFGDATEKTYGLPRTSFEIEAREGYKALVLVAKPVVWSVSIIEDSREASKGGNGINGVATNWANGCSAQSGFDYLLTNDLNRTGNNNDSSVPAFRGDSLTTFSPSGKNLNIKLTNPKVDVGDMTCYGTTTILYNNGTAKGAGYTGITQGTITLRDALVNLETRQAGSSGAIMTNRIAVAISGTGTLRAYAFTAIEGGMPVYLTGDNSGFSGNLIVSNRQVAASETTGTTLHLGTATSFGGAMPEPTADGVKLCMYSFLYPEETMTLSAENRGITIEAGGFNVPEGRALTVDVPLTIAGTAIKKGAGTLALGGVATPSSGSFTVKEGAVMAIADSAVAGLDLTFSAGAAIALDPDAEIENGFTGDLSTANPGDTIVLRLASRPADGRMEFTIPVCTVATASGDISGLFSVEQPRGYTAQLVTSTVGECTRYSVYYRRNGFILTFR